MNRRKPKIIRDNKKRGEWAEAVFVARAAEIELEISKPHGESGRFDCVVGGPGKFLSVQVKCTIAKQPNSPGYICNLKCNNKKYRPGSFELLAAYVIPEDRWFIIPEKIIRGLGAISLCSAMPKYEQYREAWHLLKSPALAKAGNAAQGVLESKGAVEEVPTEQEQTPMGPAVQRMAGAMRFFRNYLERSGK